MKTTYINTSRLGSWTFGAYFRENLRGESDDDLDSTYMTKQKVDTVDRLVGTLFHANKL